MYNLRFFHHSVIINNINFIEHVDNKNYDLLLSENIVFVNLVDASAVNTIIECIVRNTPIIVNKIPAVVEMLGENYPMYYTLLDIVLKYTLLEILVKLLSLDTLSITLMNISMT